MRARAPSTAGATQHRACGITLRPGRASCPVAGLRPIRTALYSAACVDLRGDLAAAARLAAGASGRFDEALTWRAVPGEGRFAARGRARAVEPPRSARASISAAASSSVIVSGVLSGGSVALTPPWLT